MLKQANPMTRADLLLALRQTANKAHAANEPAIYDVLMDRWHAIRNNTGGVFVTFASTSRMIWQALNILEFECAHAIDNKRTGEQCDS
jgi:hypothetical protein